MEVLEWIQEFMDEHTNLCKWRQWRALGLYAGLYIFLWVGKLSLWKLLEVVCMRPQTSIQMSTCERLYKQTVLHRGNVYALCVIFPLYCAKVFFFVFFFGQFRIIGVFIVHHLQVNLEKLILVDFEHIYTILTLTVFREISCSYKYILYSNSVIHFHKCCFDQEFRVHLVLQLLVPADMLWTKDIVLYWCYSLYSL